MAYDWVVTCKSAAEAHAAIVAARRILEQLGVELHPQKMRVVHVQRGFEFLGYKIKRGQRRLRLLPHKIQSGVREGDLYAYPKEKSIHRFMEQVRVRTKRRVPLKTSELIAGLNPLIRGWGNYYKRAHIRKLFTDSTAGSYIASGHTAASAGETGVGDSYQKPSCTVSTG